MKGTFNLNFKNRSRETWPKMRGLTAIFKTSYLTKKTPLSKNCFTVLFFIEN